MKIPDFHIKEQKDAEGNAIEAKSSQELVLDILHFAVNDTNTKDNGQKGKESTLTGTQGRMWGRIQRKFDDAIEEKAMDVPMESGEVDFLKKSMDGAAFPTAWFRWTSLIQDELEVKAEKPAK